MTTNPEEDTTTQAEDTKAEDNQTTTEEEPPAATEEESKTENEAETAPSAEEKEEESEPQPEPGPEPEAATQDNDKNDEDDFFDEAPGKVDMDAAGSNENTEASQPQESEAAPSAEAVDATDGAAAVPVPEHQEEEKGTQEKAEESAAPEEPDAGDHNTTDGPADSQDAGQQQDQCPQEAAPETQEAAPETQEAAPETQEAAVSQEAADSQEAPHAQDGADIEDRDVPDAGPEDSQPEVQVTVTAAEDSPADDQEKEASVQATEVELGMDEVDSTPANKAAESLIVQPPAETPSSLTAEDYDDDFHSEVSDTTRRPSASTVAIEAAEVEVKEEAVAEAGSAVPMAASAPAEDSEEQGLENRQPSPTEDQEALHRAMEEKARVEEEHKALHLAYVTATESGRQAQAEAEELREKCRRLEARVAELEAELAQLRDSGSDRGHQDALVKDLQSRLATLAEEDALKERRIQKLQDDLKEAQSKVIAAERQASLNREAAARMQQQPPAQSKTCVVM